MDKQNSLWIGLAGLVIGLTAGVIFLFGTIDVQLPASENSATGLTAGKTAPSLSGVSLEGEPVDLAEYRGQAVVVNVFASWCGPCRAEAPHLVEAHRRLGEEVQFIGLNLEESPQAVRGFQSEFNIPFTLILNQNGALTEIYRPVGLPISWFIDPAGIIRYVHAGPITTELLLAALEAAQAGENFDPFATNS